MASGFRAKATATGYRQSQSEFIKIESTQVNSLLTVSQQQLCSYAMKQGNAVQCLQIRAELDGATLRVLMPAKVKLRFLAWLFIIHSLFIVIDSVQC